MGASLNKVFLPLGDRPILLHSIAIMEASSEIAAYVVVVSPGEVSFCRTLLVPYQLTKLAGVVPGGAVRQESAANGVRALPSNCEIVAVQDGARPLLCVDVLDGSIRRAREVGAVVVAVPAKDTVKVVGADGGITATPERSGLWRAQTPQVFRRTLLEEAYACAERDQYQGTDDASLVERLGVRVEVYRGSEDNLKITTPRDLLVAEALLDGQMVARSCANPQQPVQLLTRTGLGYDVHPLQSGRKLCLGGVEIPGEVGLQGHSDADVVLHALMDAALGAAGLDDIGHYFPPSDSRWQDADSLALLSIVRGVLAGAGYEIAQLDLVIAAERPKLAPYLGQMKQQISAVLGLPATDMGIKATTSEGLGFVGRGEGIAAWAIVNLRDSGLPRS
jgi:2-C-methyl-D-erythritol 4-phosphate cytidylyltransferase/2-C-methyl-D-erythritol 2,4-cyclodiphosphate synthase